MTLLFVYNANSGLRNALFDAGHKLFNPSTYSCSLCALTYDTFTENSTWKSFRKNSNIHMEFLHKDEFENKFPNESITYPVVLKHEGAFLSEVLNKQDLDNIKDVEDLIKKLQTIL